MTSMYKDSLDKLLCMPLDASYEEEKKPKNKSRRKSLFSMLEFKEDKGFFVKENFPVPIEEEKGCDSTDIDSCSSRKGSSKVVTKSKKQFSIKSALVPCFMKGIESVKKDSLKRLSEQTYKCGLKVKINSFLGKNAVFSGQEKGYDFPDTFAIGGNYTQTNKICFQQEKHFN
jgi:hypothetical protein